MNAFKAWWYRRFHDPEPGNPLLVPSLDDIPLPAHLAPTDEVKSGTEKEMCALVTCTAHLKVAAMDNTQIALELPSLVRASLSELWSAPARLGEYYPPEGQR